MLSYYIIECDVGRAANTGDILNTTATDLSVGANYVLTLLPLSATTTDLQFSGAYTGGTTLTINGAALNFGTLDDLDATQSLVISNSSTTAGSITLNTASNSTSGANASDVLYVASGGNLKVQSGAGTLTLNIVTSGNIDNNGTLNISAPIGISLASTATFTGTGATTVSGAIGALLGSVAVNDAGGSVTLSGNNGYIGNTTITSGTLIASNIVVSGGVSNLGNATSNVILGGATTSGLLSYTGSTATYTRGFTVNAGGGEVDVTTAGQTLTIGSGAVTTSGSGVFTIGGAGNTSITSVIGGGSGGLTKTGTGTLNLGASNNYAGVTNINGGVVQINAANNLGSAVSTNTIGFNGGTLESTANSYSLGTTRSIALNGSGTIQVDAGGALTVNGLLSGAGTLTETGSGILSLSGANTGFTGAFIQSAGTLLLANTAALSASNAVTVNGGTLDLNGTATETIASLSGTGGTVTNSSGTSAVLTLGGSGSTTYSGSISAPSATATPTVLGLTVALTGSGSQTLSGADTYTGQTTVSSGKLIIGSATALGNGGLVRSAGSGGTTVSSGATLDLNAQANVNEVITLNGTGVGSAGALINGGATVATVGSGVSSINVSGTFTGLNANTTVSIGAPTSGTTATATAVLGVTAASFNINGGNTTYLSAPTVTISGGGGTGATAVANLTGGVVSSITITNAGSGFTSTPTISFSGGSVLLQLTNPTGTGVDGHFTLDGVAVTNNGSGYATTPTVSLSSGSVTTTANLTGVALASNSSVGGSGDLTINAAISGSGTGLTKVGADTLTLGNVEAYTGATVVSSGTLAVGVANAIASSTSLGISGGTLSLGSLNTTVNGDVTLTSGSITGTGTLTASSTGTSYSLINGSVGAVLGGTGDTLIKATDGTAAGGTVILSGANTYTGATTINAGTLEVDGSLASGSSVTIGGASGSAAPTLTGSGTINGAVTVSSASGGTAGTINPGGIGTTGTLTVGSITFQNGGDLSLDLSGVNTDLLKVTNAATIVAGAGIKVAGSALTLGDYVLATAASGLNSASLTVVGSLPSGYKLLQSSTELDLQHLADQTLTSTTSANLSIILNSSTPIGALLSNIVPVGSSFLNVNLADGGGTGGVVTGLTSSAGTTIAGGASSTIAGTLTATTAGLGETWIVKNTDLGALTSTVSASGTLNVYNHSNPTLTITTGNNQSAFLGGTLSNATLTLSDTAGVYPAPLDVSTLVNLTGNTGSGVVATGGTGLYTSVSLGTATAGIGQTLAVSLKAGDQQTIIGAGPLSTLSQTITYNVYNHATPTLTIGSGNNQSGILGSTLSNATLTLSDTTGTAPSPLDVNTLVNLTGATGSAVIGSGSTGTYTSTALNTSSVGLGQTLAVSLKAGDEQAITGANALSTLGQTITYNVYNHSTPTLTIGLGNNQSVFVNGSLSTATLTLADTTGTLPAPLDVSTLSNLTGSTGSGVIASNSNGTYTVTGFNTATAGIGQSLVASLKAGDQQTIAGANALSTLSQTLTYNVYTHTTPTLTVGSGNNQSAILGSTLSGVTLVLSDTTGTAPAPLDVSTLVNLTGATGSGVIGSGSSGTYTSTALNTSIAGIGKTLAVSLKTGDEQAIPGANALSTLGQTITYNVYNHSTPTLTIGMGNNQSIFINGSFSAATLNLADTTGTTPAPLDVNSLSNLTGSTGSGVIASNSSGTYTVTGFNSASAGIGQTLVASLKAGDQQTVTGANALSTLSQTLTYNVYNHATPALTIGSGNNQSGIVGSTLSNATLTLADSGTAPAPLDVNTLTNLTGSTGSAVVGSGSTGTYTSSALSTATAGIGQTLAVSLKAGDEQAITGASALSTLGQTITYNVYNHSTPTLTIGLGNNQSVFVNGSLSTATLNLSDTAGTVPAPLDVNTLSNLIGSTGSGVIVSNSSGTYTVTGFNTATAGLGQTLVASLKAGDQQTVTGANALSTLSQTLTYNVYNHSAPTLTIGLGNNQSVIVNGTITGATVTLADPGTLPAPLDVNSLSNLTGSTGSAVIATDSTGTYTVTGFNTTTAGLGQTLAVSLKAGDEQAISGANALTTLSQTLTYNVYNHAAPTLTLATGNNQSGIIGSTLANATLTLADPGTLVASLDVNTLSNLTGTTGSGVVGSGSSGTYTSSALSTATAGIGQTLAVSLKAGDQQTITGANALSTLGQTVTYNVYNHSTPTLTIGTGNNQSVFINGSLSSATLTLADTTGTTPAPLDVNTLSNLTGLTGSGVVASGGNGTYTATGFNTSVAGLAKTLTLSLKTGDQQTITGASALSTLSQTLTYNVYNHATPTLSITSGNNQSGIVGSTLSNATLTLADAGTVPAPLDVASLSNLSGASGSGVVASGGSGTYTSSALSTSTAGVGQTVIVSLSAGDEQSIPGANALGTLSQSIVYNVYNHSTPTLTIGTGNNQSVFVNGSISGATLTLSDAGTLPAPLDVNSLSNLTGSTGSGVIASNSSGTYTVTGFNTSVAGIGQTLVAGLKAGDQQTVTGANPLATLSQTLTYNVYNHAMPTLTIATGNHQSAILGSTLANATLVLADPGTFTVPLDVNTLSNLTGSTGTAVVSSGGSGTYTSTALNTLVAGIGQTLAVSLKAGDEQAISGANALGTLSQSITYNVYNHSTPTLTIGSGNNQSTFVNGTISGATVSLADSGTLPAPLDVSTLSNLLGATGSGVIASGTTGTYTVNGFNTTTAGLGETDAVSLLAGDQQTITGASALSTLNQAITYNVYNHTTPTFTLLTGNNQSGIVGSTLANATFTLSDPGTLSAPLDVNTLTNLTGTTGSGVVVSGASGAYVSTALNTSAAGLGQTLAVSLKSGDEQTISGANALSTLGQTVTYNVYNHSTPTLTIGAGNNQSVFVSGSISGATLTLADTTGTVPAPLDVSTLTNLTGSTGSGVIASAGTGTYTVTGFNTTTAGIGETLIASLKAGDQQTITGANALNTLSQTLTYNVYNHATPTLGIGTGNNQSVFVNGTLGTATVILADSGVVPAPLDVSTLSNLSGVTGSGVIGSNSSGTYTVTGFNTSVAGIGQTLATSLKAGDQQTISGANALGTLSQSVTYNVYNHATPTLTVAGGNNQSAFLNGALSSATVTLADSGSVPAPLDVSTLSNLVGATGSGVVASNGTGTYVVAGFITAAVGIGKTITVSLKAGDEQSISGANALSTLGQTFTYNIYNHATPTLTVAGGNNQSAFVNGSVTGATVTLADAGTTPAPLDVNTLNNLLGATGTDVIASNSTGTYTVTGFNTSTAGLGQTLAVSLDAGDEQSISGANALGLLGQTVTYNVYNHSAPTLTLTSGNNQSGIVGSTLSLAVLGLADTAGTVPAPLDVGSLTNLTGVTGSGVIGSNTVGTYTATALNTSTAGLGKTLAVSLNAGDEQAISGANALSTLGQTITYNVYNHSTPTLTIGSGNNQSVFVNGSLAGATLNLADTTGTLPAPLDVSTLSNLTGATGSGVIATGSSGTYTATGFSTATAGVGKSLAVSLKAGDQQTVTGANPLSTLGQTITYNVYNHSTPTFVIASGNNQSVILGSTLGNATFTLADLGTVPAPLDVNSLGNLTGATGSGVIASGGAGTYTSSPLNASAVGLGQTLTVSLNAGDEQSISGANALTALSQTVTYNVYNHSTPTLTIGTGNNQSIFVNGSLSSATVTLADSGTAPAPLDVSTLGNLLGSIGSGVIGSNSSGTYTATGFNTTSAGIGKTLVVSLKAGDQQIIAGANPLATLSQSIAYNVYNHATPTLVIASGNNQSGIVGSTLANGTLTLSDTGTAPAPLDVNSLNNLTGAIGSGVVGSGSSGTYTSTALNTLTVGLGQTLTVSLNAGDQQTIAGANALSALSQVISYNVYDHSTPTLTISGGNNQSTFVGGSLSGAILTLTDTGTLPAPLDVNSLSNLTGATGSGVIGSDSTGTYTVTGFNTSTAGIGQTLVASLNAGDQQSVAGASALNTYSQTLTYNVYNHAAPTLTIATGNNQSGFVGSTLANATLILADPGAFTVPLDVSTLNNLAGLTGLALIAPGGTGTYTTAALNTATAGIGQTLAVSLKAGDEQSITGANPLGTLGQSITYNVYNHATPVLTVGSGNNQSAFVNGSVAGATVTLADSGNSPAPLDVNSLTNLIGATGSGVIGSNSSGTYTVTGFNTSTLGIGQTIMVGLQAGDEQAISGANALSTLNQVVTYNVYNHATPTLTISSGNNQSVFLNGTISGASLTLADLGIVPAPLDVNSLTNLIGSTGSGVIASNGSGIYTATGFITSTAGMGQTLVVSLKAGDQQSISGANVLGTLSQTFTYNVYNHSTPTLTIATGNNQSGFVGSTLSNATLILEDTSSDSVPLDVNSLVNLTGATGSNVVAPGGSGLYTSINLNTGTAGLGQTLAVGLRAGDEQSITGANAMSTLGQTVTYNVYNHATPTLTITAGNNQSGIIGSVLSNATVTVADPGSLSAPLDVNTLNNLIGAAGLGVIGSGGSGTYTTTPLNTLAVGLGQTLAVGLNAGDEQAITGANALSALAQTVTYNVYNHSAPTLATVTGNNQTVFINNAITAPTFLLSNSAGTLPAPLDVGALSNLMGASGSGIISSGGTSTYTATGFSTSTAGNETLTVSLQAGDQQTITGANPLSTLSQTINYTVLDHADPMLNGDTLNLGNQHVGYTNDVISSNDLTATNATSTTNGVDLQGSAPDLGTLDVTDIDNVTPGQTDVLWGTLDPGHPVGVIDAPMTYIFSDDSSIPGALSDVGTATITLLGEVYSGQSTWTGDGAATATWGTLATGFGTNWGAVQGSPGLDPNFADTDSATFGNVTGESSQMIMLNGADPSLDSITFDGSSTSYTIAAGSGGDITLDGGTNPSTVTDNATGGTQTISAPIVLEGDPIINVAAGDTMVFSGVISGTGDLVTIGPGTAVLSATNTYSGATTINAGTLEVDGSLDPSSVVTVGGASASGTPILTGTGTVGGPVTLSSASGGAFGTINPGQVGTIGTLTVGSITFQAGSLFSLDMSGANTDLLNITHAATIVAGADIQITANALTQGTYVLATAASGLNSNNFTVLGSLPSGYVLVVTATSLDLQHLGAASFVPTSTSTLNMITGATTTIGATLGNGTPSGSAALAVNLADNGGTGGVVSGLTSSSGSTVAPGASSNISGTLTAGTVGLGETWSIKNTDPNAVIPVASTGGSVNVYNHSAASLAIGAGNNQSAIVGSSLSGASLVLTNGGTLPVPLDVNSLTNLTGATGSGVVGSNSTGTYTSSALNSSTAGVGQTLMVSLKAGDQQIVIGANPLGTLSQSITYNVYNHSAPTMVVISGNNQSGIVGSTLSIPMLNLSDTAGVVPAPLDVTTLNNLTGASGSGAVGSGLSSIYSASALSTATAGVGQTLSVSLKAGDQQTVVGANPLATLGQTITYNVYNHSTPTLTITAGNNQSAIVGSTLTDATLLLSDTAGTVPAPLDVNTLTNLTGASGTAIVATGGTGTYTSTPLNTSTAGIGKMLAVSLKAGDEQTVTGASPLGTLSQSVIYNVYNHSTPTLTIGAGNNQSVFVNGSVTGATVTLADNGTVPAPLEVSTLSNLTGATGSGVISSGASGTYTATGFNTTSVGLGQTLAVGLKAGDQQTIVGANPLGSLNQTITYNVYNHATSSLSSGTLNLGNIHVGYAAAVTSTNSLLTTNGAVNDLRVNLQGSAPASGNVSLISLSGIASGSSGAISATLATGQSVGNINTPLTYTFADQSAITGASSNVGTAAITVSGQVYSGLGVWAGNGTAAGSWGTLISGFGSNWGANEGSPGLDASFTSTDTAAFGNVGGQASQLVTLDGANPSLNSITFNASSTNYTIAQGSGGTVTLNGGAGSATINDAATGGTQTISAPTGLATNTNVAIAANHTLTILGNISGPGGLTTMGPGTLALSGTDDYAGPTTLNSGKLAVIGSTLATGTVMVGNGATLTGTGSTGVVTVAGGGSINLQDGVIGTLTVNGLTVGNASNASVLSFDIASGSSNNLDRIADNGTLALNGVGGTTINIGTVTDTPVLTSGTYTLISSTGLTGTLADVSLSHTTLDGKSLALALVGNSLDLAVTDLVNTTTYSLSASTTDSRIMENTGSTTVTSTIINSGSADTLTYTGLSATTSAGTLTGVTLPQDGGPLAKNGGSASGTSILSNVGSTGIVTITPVVSSANNAMLGGSALLDSAATTTVDVVANRVVTATSVAFGRVIVGQAINAVSTLSTTGDDADFTRVTVGSSGTDANGISATGGNTEVFNGPSVTDTRNVSGTFSTAGSVANTLTMITTGEGLAGEAPINVALGYTADPVNKRVITNGATTNLGTFHTGAAVSATSTAFTTTGTHDTTTDVSVAEGNGVADANGVVLTDAPTIFDGTTSSDTRTFGGTMNSGSGGVVTGSFNLAVTTLENSGAGLLGEGAYSPVNVAYTAFVYTGQGIWNASGSGDWGTVATPTNWTADGGAPGLDSDFTSTDTATFGNSIGSGTATVSLDGDSPSLVGVTFANTMGGSYVLAQGSGGTLILNGGAGSATINNAAGNNTITAPVQLDTGVTISTASNSNLELAGNIGESGGSQAVTLAGAGTTLLVGANSYSGGTTISSGTVEAGSPTAFGTGNVTLNGGVLEVGNGAHEIDVAQNYTQNGGTLLLNLYGGRPGAAGGYEFLRVAGTANLGGALQVNVQPVYIPVNGETFTFVQAGAITGGFSSESTNLRALSITPQGVGTIILTQLPFVSMPSVQEDPNENAIATYIDNIYLSGTGNQPFESLVAALDAETAESLPTSALTGALDQLSTEKFHNYVRETVFNNASFSTQILDGYLEARRSPKGDFLPGDGSIDSSNLTINDPNIDPGLAQVASQLMAWSPAPLPNGLLSDSSLAIQAKPGLPAPAAANAHSNLNLFISGNVTVAQGFSQADLSHFNSTSGGTQLGASYRFTPHFVVGTYFSYNHADGDLDTIGSKATIDSYAPGVFLSFADRGWYANALGSYGFDNFTENRSISFGGLSGTSRGAPSGNEIIGNFDGGYDFHVKQWTFGPAAGLEHTHVAVDGFAEDGFTPTDLRVNRAETSSLRSRIGGHLTRSLQVKKALITPHVDAFWQHEFLDEGQDISAQLANVGGDSFTITTPRASRDSALIDAGLNADLNGQVSVYFDYLVQAGQNNYFGQSVQAGVKVGF